MHLGKKVGPLTYRDSLRFQMDISSVAAVNVASMMIRSRGPPRVKFRTVRPYGEQDLSAARSYARRKYQRD